MSAVAAPAGRRADGRRRSRPLALVLAGPGTNRDPDAALALGRAGADAEIARVDELVARPARLAEVDLVVIAGGFSYGDALGAGRMLALDITHAAGAGPNGADIGERLGDALRTFVARGGPVIGICNGFQVLTRAGLLPGSLGHNESGRFDCRWVTLVKAPDTQCVWTAGPGNLIDCPIAHGEGRYVHLDPAALDHAGQVALRYRANPNGSVDDIAGVCDETGLVLGLMPHPENHAVVRQHPRARHDPSTAERLGLGLFTAGVAHVS